MKKNNSVLLNDLKFLTNISMTANCNVADLLTKKELSFLKKNNLIDENSIISKLNMLGNIWKEKLLLFRFFQDNGDYFLSHSFADIPESLLKQFEKLSNSRLLIGIWPNFTYWKKIILESKRFLYCILTQPPFLLGDAIFEKLDSDIDIRFLFGRNSDIPDCNDLVERLELNKFNKQEKIKKRITENVGINLIMSENECSMMFPEDGIADIQKSFVSNDPVFLNWCQEFFNYKWLDGEDFSRLKINS